MSTGLDLRPYRPGDETAILDLFARSFERPMSAEYWRWRFADNPAGGPLAELAWDGERLAAHYAVSATRLSDGGGQVAAALSVTTMTAPDYRGLGLFPALAERLYARLAAAETAAVFGFPNTNSHDGFVAGLGWRDIALLAQLTLEPGAMRRPTALPAGLRTLPRADARFDALWDQAAAHMGLSTVSDAAYVNWRYCDHPFNRYRLLALEDGATLAGYAVLKPFGAEAADLVDLVGRDPAAVEALLAGTAALARAEGVARLHTWIGLHRPEYLAATRLGYVAGAPVTYFGGRALARAPRDFADPRRWRPCMGDSDVY